MARQDADSPPIGRLRLRPGTGVLVHMRPVAVQTGRRHRRDASVARHRLREEVVRRVEGPPFGVGAGQPAEHMAVPVHSGGREPQVQRLVRPARRLQDRRPLLGELLRRCRVALGPVKAGQCRVEEVERALGPGSGQPGRPVLRKRSDQVGGPEVGGLDVVDPCQHAAAGQQREHQVRHHRRLELLGDAAPG